MDPRTVPEHLCIPTHISRNLVRRHPKMIRHEPGPQTERLLYYKPRPTSFLAQTTALSIMHGKGKGSQLPQAELPSSPLYHVVYH